MKIQKENLKYFSSVTEFREFLIKAYQFVKQQFLLYNIKESHSLEHTIRVVNSCINLACKLNGAVDVVVIAALFHDVGRSLEDALSKCHAETSSEIASSFLIQNSFNDMVPEIRDIILSHRYSKKREPATKEGKILKDADALDALGAIGLYRTISYSVENGYGLERALEHFEEKLFRLSGLMRFDLTKKIAEEETEMLKDFVKQAENGIENSNFEMTIKKLS
ncbi:MAG: HD domain-containing protein [Asgard group archaeon]|nr:HD domain-containing protein [Asgard group archaeon]